MQMLVLVLNKTEVLEELLKSMTHNSINGATILESTGMAHALFAKEDTAFLGSLRLLLDPEHEKNKTIFMVLKDDMVDTAIRVIENVVGDLSRPDTGVIFTMPVGRCVGIPSLNEA